MSKTYRVALIGCGGRAREHVPGLVADPRCQVVALADVKAEAAEKMNADFQLNAKVYTDYHEMLAAERPEVVVTCLWTPMHLPVFRDCAQAGVRAVMSEKPMAPTWGECKEIARIAEETGCILTFSHQRRFSPGNQLVRKLVEEGRFGKVVRMDLYAPPNLLDCGTHTFDQALSFNRETPAKWVLGAVDTTKVLKWFNVSSESLAIGFVLFENGVRANYQIGGSDKDLDTGVRVIGTEGFIEAEWDGQIKRAVVYAEPEWKVEQPEIKTERFMVDYVRDVMDCLETGREPVLDYHKGLRASEIIFALYESVRRHAVVQLPLDTTDNAFITMLEAGAFGPQPEAPKP